MTPASGWVATFRCKTVSKDGSEHVWYEHDDVAFFDASARGWVSRGETGLEVAEDLPGFVRYELAEAPYVALLAAGDGWAYREGDSEPWPITAWALRADGVIYPVAVTGDGAEVIDGSLSSGPISVEPVGGWPEPEEER